MKTTHKSIVAVAASAAFLAVLVPTAEASRSVGGFAGHEDNAGQNSCFAENWNGVTNTCNSAVRWDIPLPIDGGGHYNSPEIQVFVSGVASNVSCTVQGVSGDGSSIVSDPWNNPTNGNTNAIVQPGFLSIPSAGGTQGTLEAACFIGKGSIIRGVQWG
jgi:hypothetical protein